MKIITFLLLIIAVNCKGQVKDSASDRNYTRDVPANWITPFKVTIRDTSERYIYYDVWVGGHGKLYPAAYKMKDSAWVVRDTAETLKMALWYLEQQARQLNAIGKKQL